VSGEKFACDYSKFAGHFGSFLPLAGVFTINESKDTGENERGAPRYALNQPPEHPKGACPT
jgi:hypothetical protein